MRQRPPASQQMLEVCICSAHILPASYNPSPAKGLNTLCDPGNKKKESFKPRKKFKDTLKSKKEAEVGRTQILGQPGLYDEPVSKFSFYHLPSIDTVCLHRPWVQHDVLDL